MLGTSPDDKGGGWRDNGGKNTQHAQGKYGTNKGDKMHLQSITIPDKASNPNRTFSGPSRRINEAEFQAKRAKGLCFRCDEKYSFGHKCKNRETRELRVLLVDEFEEIEIIQEEPEEDPPAAKTMEVEKVEGEEIGDLVELDLKSVIGFSTPGTMKVRGTIKGQEVMVLIDCGATHNFVSKRLVDELHMPLKETSNYGIVMGNGVAIKGKGVCRRLNVTFSI